MRAILTALTTILLLLPCSAQAQSVLRIGLNDDPDALDPTIRLLVSRIEGVAQHPDTSASSTTATTTSAARRP